jgi:cytidylate kinase
MLKERNNVLKVYVCAALPDRIARAVEYGIPEKKARHFIQETDARRAAFYEYNTSCRWGDPALFDLVIDTSKMSLEEAVDRIEEHIHKKEA